MITLWSHLLIFLHIIPPISLASTFSHISAKSKVPNPHLSLHKLGLYLLQMDMQDEYLLALVSIQVTVSLGYHKPWLEHIHILCAFGTYVCVAYAIF